MASDIAGWKARLPERVAHARASALRQLLDAGVRWGYIGTNPAKADRNPKPPPRAVRAYSREELDAIAAELSPRYRPLPAFAAGTGLRPVEWLALERRDIDGEILTVRRTVSSGAIVELGKTARSRRRCP
jgi:integrase